MRRYRNLLVLALCVLVPLRALEIPLACIATPTPADLASPPMPVMMSHEDCETTAQDVTASGDRVTLCHCVALSGWSPLMLVTGLEQNSVPGTLRTLGVIDHFAPRIWRPPAVGASSS